MKNWELDWPAILIGFSCLLVGMLVGVEPVIHMRNEAVQAGVACWVITDTNTGATSFQWITNKHDTTGHP